MDDNRDMPNWLEEEFKRLAPKVVWEMDLDAAKELVELAGIAHFRAKVWTPSATSSGAMLGESNLTLGHRVSRWEAGEEADTYGGGKWKDYLSSLDLNEGTLVRLHQCIIEASVLVDNAPQSEEQTYALEMLKKALCLFPDFDPRWSGGATGGGSLIMQE